MMNVFWQELRTYRTSTIIWTLALALLVIVFLGMYPTFTKDVAMSQKIIANLPLVLRESFGISVQTFFTVLGFYSYLLSVASVAAAVQAMNLGVGAISKEESGKTADFLLTKPISRTSILTSKLSAVLCLIVVTNIAFVAVSFAAAHLYSTAPFNEAALFYIALSVFLIQVFFVALGALCAVLLRRVKSVVAVSLPIVFAFFIVGTLGTILGSDMVRYVSPFKFYDTSYIATHGAYEMQYLLIEFAVVVVLIVATYVIFGRKDIHAGA